MTEYRSEKNGLYSITGPSRGPLAGFRERVLHVLYSIKSNLTGVVAHMYAPKTVKCTSTIISGPYRLFILAYVEHARAQFSQKVPIQSKITLDRLEV